MPPVRKKRVSSKKSKKSDTPVVQNSSNTELTFDEVKEKLRKQGIRAPSTFTKEQLLELLNENSGQDNTVMPEIPALTQLTTSLNNMEQTVQNQGTLIQSLLVRESNIISQPAVVSDINNGVHHDTGSYHTTKVSSGMFPHVQAVAPNVRKQILEGKYINLATLLNNQENVQDYKTVDESDGSVLLIKHRDPRLQRNLSIQEFLEAFNIYKNIICEKQDRRIEFDMYIQDVIDISARYKGPVFYEYHKAFANKVAAIKLTHGKVVDWSIRDEKLYSSITSGQIIKECETCGSLGHLTAVCQTLPSFGQSNNRSKPTYNQTHFQKSQVGSNDRVDSNTDIRGRPVLFFRGREVCNNFLSGKCFKGTKCSFAHVNTRSSTGATTNNKNFVFNLINGLRYGFDTGINVLPSKSLECKNLLSTKKFPDDVTKLVDDELRKGYLIGPFTKPPFDTYRISPIGIVEGKYSKKKRLILDLSAPHNNDEHHSINDLINKEDYSLTYVRIDDAINIIKSLGIKSQLCKCDVTDAFKLIPVHNSLWRFYGLKWNDMYYFYTRLAFGCRSSPKIFDTLSVAICWILQNNYGLRHVLHLLDDFLLINNPYVDATRNMNTMLYVFNSLKIPLSAHKTVGPSTSLEYLGIILDSMHMIAKLPDEKLVRIKDILYSYLNRRSCTKREMLSLLGHLNYACKVIIPGRSFVSYLLTLAHSVKELYHHVTITKGCRDDMAMWFKFLSQWNGISFFISDNVINASDFHLFTDASSTIGYGGYFRKRWFQGSWPDDFIRPDEESFSMAYLELYPIVISAILWGHEWSTKRILFHCDNMSSVYIINKGRSKCNVIMNLVRRLTWCAAKFNFVVHAVHVPGKENNIADALSRYQMKRFRQLAPDASPNPCTCPPHSEILWS
ncbi:unnamed protein product [Mytilus edulis]|uniref:C3H1-type domain-containing protein n=1 Tax=Mytilus edulis TaxID=6550 RepID=A0A8S3UK21_MYTED|nr:unnamed protein product [Mytilus edulis]